MMDKLKCVKPSTVWKMLVLTGVNSELVNGNSPNKMNVSQLVDVGMKPMEPLKLTLVLMMNVGCSMNHVIQKLNLKTIVLVMINMMVLSMIVLMINVTGIGKLCSGI